LSRGLGSIRGFGADGGTAARLVRPKFWGLNQKKEEYRSTYAGLETLDTRRKGSSDGGGGHVPAGRQEIRVDESLSCEMKINADCGSPRLQAASVSQDRGKPPEGEGKEVNSWGQ